MSCGFLVFTVCACLFLVVGLLKQPANGRAYAAHYEPVAPAQLQMGWITELPCPTALAAKGCSEVTLTEDREEGLEYWCVYPESHSSIPAVNRAVHVPDLPMCVNKAIII